MSTSRGPRVMLHQLSIGQALFVFLGVALVIFSWPTGSDLARAEQPAGDVALDRLTAEQLQEQLLKVPEIDLLGSKEAGATLQKEVKAMQDAKAAPKERRDAAPAALEFQNSRWQALGLTCRPETDRLIFPHEAEYLQSTARQLRAGRVVALPDRGTSLAPPKVDTFEQLQRALELKAGASVPHHVTPALNQMLQAEGDATRALLVEAMAGIDTNYSTCCLTERALYDTSPKVRQAALRTLAARPREDSRPMLLEGLRYPWAPVAQHAAEALVALQDRDALPALTRLLDAPDPQAAFTPPGAGKPVVREVVRINHLRNCVLCHAPSVSRDDLVQAPVPKPGQPLVILYYGQPQPSQPKDDDIFVRADVTYLRQDFSLSQKVAKSDPWPEQQRFDFLVRTRTATAAEVAAKPSATYPQREAVCFAIDGLKKLPARTSTGK
jgi:hypothetical protein